jgi:D-alanyl-D-alanine carboxypeptidase
MLQKFAAAMAILAAITMPAAASGAADEREVSAGLDNVLQSARSQPALVPAAMLRAVAPRLGLTWEKALGTPHDTSQTLRIASNTKTYIAAATLRLVEDGRLDLDLPVAGHLLPESRRLLKSGGYDLQAITPRMLLQHTSGVYDYASDERYLERVATQPDHRWTRHEQLAMAMAGGAAYGKPGERYHYSDTGYVLLGEVLETTTGQPMPEALRNLLGFESLGIAHTWFETLEPEPADAPARLVQWFDGVEVATLDASSDLFGGGGLVSTLEDMTRFYRALLQGEVFRRPGTLATMLEPSPQSIASGEGGYGMGLGRMMIDGQACHGHGGFWGTEAWHCPGVDVTVAGAVSSTAGQESLHAMTRAALALLIAEIAATDASGSPPGRDDSLEFPVRKTFRSRAPAFIR